MPSAHHLFPIVEAIVSFGLDQGDPPWLDEVLEMNRFKFNSAELLRDSLITKYAKILKEKLKMQMSSTLPGSLKKGSGPRIL